MKIGDSNVVLIVADSIENQPASDIKGKEVLLQGKQEVIVNTGLLNIKDLADIGMVIPFNYSQGSSNGFNWTSTLGLIVTLVIVCGAFIFLTRSDILIGKSSQFKKEKNSITFADVGGIDDIKDSLLEAVSFLKDRNYLENLGAKIPRGILLTGSPGIGKTLVAKATASEANVPFYYTTGSEFHTMWAGMAGQRIKKLFKQAKEKPSIIFIDEFDSIAQTRGFGTGEVGREFDHTLNQLLAEMDGFDNTSKVLVIAATNNPQVLDPAILRPGRFDRKIHMSLPSYKERCSIFGIHMKGKHISSDVNVESIAKQTSGLSGAELAAIINEAAIVAGRKHKSDICMADIDESLDKVIAGNLRQGLTMTDSEKKLVAYHEAGHTLVASKLPNCDKVQRISILPHGNAGGFTRLSSEKEDLVLSKSKAMDSISMLLGGRAAEELVIGDISSSAENDLMKANQIATEMVERFGMSKGFGLRYCAKNNNGIKDISLESAKVVDGEISSFLEICYNKACEIVRDNRELLDKIATKLIDVETMNAEDLDEVLKA
jgi:cell division protease FtsH